MSAGNALPPHDRHSVTTFFATSSALIIVSLATIAARVYVSLHKRIQLKWDDWLVVAAMVFACTSWVIQSVSLYPYLNTNATLPDLESQRYLVRMVAHSCIPWTLAVVSIKVSLLLTLLTLHDRTDGYYWRVFLRAMIAVQGVFAIGDIVFQSALTNLASSAACIQGQSPRCEIIMTVATWIEALFNVITDIIISLMPITFITQLRRPMWEKILITMLMAIGLLISVASIRKSLVVKSFHGGDDFDLLAWVTKLNTWTCAEMYFGIIAACLPRLKSSFARCLSALGINLSALVRSRLGTAPGEHRSERPGGPDDIVVLKAYSVTVDDAKIGQEKSDSIRGDSKQSLDKLWTWDGKSSTGSNSGSHEAKGTWLSTRSVP